MGNLTVRESSTRDRLDLQIIHALQLWPRAPFARIAEVTEVSEQTVARRYRRLRDDGVLRVVGLVDTRRVGQHDWIVRVQVRPGASLKLAEALARRDDVSWVTVSAAGSEVVGSVRSRSREQRDELLLERLPSTAAVLSISACAVLHEFAGGGPDWLGYGAQLSAEQAARLIEGLPTGPPPGPPPRIEPADEPMLSLLARDGRAGYAALAEAAGWTEGRVARRLDALHRHGVVYFDVDLAGRLLGFATTAYLWLVVEPSRIQALGSELASYAEVPFAAAVTGAANLLASVMCRDISELYEFTSGRIGALDGVRQLEISPELRRLKQAGSLLDGPRLADPAPPRPRTARR